MKINSISKYRLRLIFPLLLTAFFVGFSIQNTTAQSANHRPNIEADEFTAKGAGLQEGSIIPNFSFNDVYSKKMNMYDLLNRATVMAFYSLNDPDIAKKTKYLKTFYKQFNINIIGITTDEYPNRIRKYQGDNALDWPNIQDDSKKFGANSFVDNQGIGNAQFLIITPEKKVHKVIPAGKPIGMLGAELQKYFSN